MEIFIWEWFLRLIFYFTFKLMTKFKQGGYNLDFHIHEIRKKTSKSSNVILSPTEIL